MDLEIINKLSEFEKEKKTILLNIEENKNRLIDDILINKQNMVDNLKPKKITYYVKLKLFFKKIIKF